MDYFFYFCKIQLNYRYETRKKDERQTDLRNQKRSQLFIFFWGVGGSRLGNEQ